ncbi:DegT/DnrJ/EryC1/StrS family aminotransferase [bacterium]|nr:DegT/DnrJ/EryC1/StrS family aminotransferase [bacterium]
MVKRKQFLPFALPDTGDAEFLEIKEALDSGWITTGPKTRQFEQLFAAAVGSKHAIAVNSCTAAMHLALDAIGLQPGDEVITTPYTFAATAEVIRYFQAKPVFVDICSSDLNINIDLIEAVISEQTKAILPVHIAGLPADLDSINAIAKNYDLAVIEDAAHAFPAKYKGRMIGTTRPQNSDSTLKGNFVQNSVVCFSFYATKTITTGEGGMICTNNDEIAERCRIMALHWISKDAWKRYTAEGSWYYEIIAPGYKYNLTDIASAIGLAQLRKAHQMWERRLDLAHRYNEAFHSVPELQTPSDRADCQHAWHLYILRLNTKRLNISRNKFNDELKARNIGTSVHFIPLHLHPYYQKTYGYRPEDFPVSFSEYQRVISLPIYSKMSDQDVSDVIYNILELVNQYKIY